MIVCSKCLKKMCECKNPPEFWRHVEVPDDQGQKPNAPAREWTLETIRANYKRTSHLDDTQENHVLNLLVEMVDKFKEQYESKAKMYCTERDRADALEKRVEEAERLLIQGPEIVKALTDELVTARDAAERWKDRYNKLTNPPSDYIDSNSAAGWMVKYQRQFDLMIEANRRIKELETQLANRAEPMGLFREIDQFKEREKKLVSALQPFAELLPHVSTEILAKEFKGDYWNPAIQGPDLATAREVLTVQKEGVKNDSQ